MRSDVVRRAYSILVLSLLGCAGTREPVRPGLEVLLSDSIHILHERRVALLTNPTGIDREGRRGIDRLHTHDGVDLVALYAPEHGIAARLDGPDVPDEVDEATGLPVFGLYSPNRPIDPARFRDIDVLLIDLQDIGARTFTYASTVRQILEAAAETELQVVVLDRPNPIGGLLSQGPMRDEGIDDFVAALPVPLRHGLTIGELAVLANRSVGAGLTVIPAAGWRRSMWFDETGLPWVRPSPNMPSLESAAHYPGTVLFEATNVSVGRGTDRAFQQIGAPWMDAAAVAEAFDSHGVAGVGIAPVVFTPRAPTDGKYPEVEIPGVRLTVLDRQTYDPTWAGLLLLWTIHAQHPDALTIRDAALDARAGTAMVRTALRQGRPLGELLEAFEAGRRSFSGVREGVLLYP